MAEICYVPLEEMIRLRTLPGGREQHAAAFAAACRINTLYAITRAGSGHIGSSFSCLDIVTWLFLNELRRDESGRPLDTFFSSKGHDVPALYSVLTGLGLLDFEMLHRLRRLGGVPGHPDVSVSGLEANTGSLGMGISKAKGMIQANRLLGRTAALYVLTGDGELQEGQFWESLASAAARKMGELTVIVDHNKMQSDTFVSEVSDLGDLEAKFRAFGWHVARCDGHDPTVLGRVFDGLRTIADRPKVIIADTLKGKGVSFMQPEAMDPVERLYKFHSGAPSPENYSRALTELVATANQCLAGLGADPLHLKGTERPTPPAAVRPQRLVAAYAKALVRQAELNPRLVALDADLVLDCGLIPFRQRFPERFFECGIAEQDMVSQAGGMALRGLLPVVHSFACFLSTRPNEQIYNNATERSQIIYVGSLAGLLPGGPGHSHQSVRDVAALAAVPGLIIVEPSCEAEVEAALDFCTQETQQSSYLRLVSIPVDVPYVLPADYRMELGKGTVLRDGKDAALISSGPVMLSQACQAANLLHQKHDLSVAVINLPWLNRVDSWWLSELAAAYPMIFILENHYTFGGQGQMLASRLAELPLRPMPLVRRFGVDRIPHCGWNDEVLAEHRLDAQSLARDLKRALVGGAVATPT